MKLESIALHSGYTSEETTKAAAVPIYQTTSYTFDDTQHGADLFDLKVPGNIYTRIMNPTTAVLEQRIAEMEGGIGALAVASGMAAIYDAGVAARGVTLYLDAIQLVKLVEYVQDAGFDADDDGDFDGAELNEDGFVAEDLV